VLLQLLLLQLLRIASWALPLLSLVVVVLLLLLLLLFMDLIIWPLLGINSHVLQQLLLRGWLAVPQAAAPINSPLIQKFHCSGQSCQAATHNGHLQLGGALCVLCVF
jgi:hypothetical protein